MSYSGINNGILLRSRQLQKTTTVSDGILKKISKLAQF